jgi:hypothetical protein
LSVLARARHPARWLWPDLPDLPKVIERAPKSLRLSTDRRKWAEAKLDEEEATRLEALQSALERGGRREVAFDGEELTLHMGGEPTLRGIYLDEGPGELTAAYWRWLLLSSQPRHAQRYASDLRRPPIGHDTPAAKQFIGRVAAFAVETDAIAAAEKEMNEFLYALYRLSPEERALVDNDRARRSAALSAGGIG